MKEMVGLSLVLTQHHLVRCSMVMRCDMCGVWGEDQLQVIVGLSLSLSLSPLLQPRMIDAYGCEPIAGYYK